MKRARKKILVGEKVCYIEDSEVGCAPWNADCPTDSIDFNVSCSFQDKSKTCKRCLYPGRCDFAREVTRGDAADYPELFDNRGEKE